MTTSLQPLTMRPGTVCPTYIFGGDVNAADGGVLASFKTHGQAFRALSVADGRGSFPAWMASMTSQDVAKVQALNAYLADQDEYKA